MNLSATGSVSPIGGQAEVAPHVAQCRKRAPSRQRSLDWETVGGYRRGGRAALTFTRGSTGRRRPRSLPSVMLRKEGENRRTASAGKLSALGSLNSKAQPSFGRPSVIPLALTARRAVTLWEALVCCHIQRECEALMRRRKGNWISRGERWESAAKLR